VAVVIDANVDGLDGLMARLRVAPEKMALETDRAMHEAVLVVEGEVKALTPRKTGRLFSDWGTQTRGFGFEVVGLVANHVSYAPFVEFGTRPHEIVAHGDALVIPTGGRALTGRALKGQPFIFRKKVRHPGTTGQHMAAKGLAVARGTVLDIFRRAAQRALGR
jgi:hypothetical protein